MVFCMVNWLAIATLKRHRATPQLATPAAVLLILLCCADHARAGQLHHPRTLEPGCGGTAGQHGGRDRGPRRLRSAAAGHHRHPCDSDPPPCRAGLSRRHSLANATRRRSSGARMTTAPAAHRRLGRHAASRPPGTAARLCAAHQDSRDHAGGGHCLVRILLRPAQVRAACAHHQAALGAGRNRHGLGRHGLHE